MHYKIGVAFAATLLTVSACTTTRQVSDLGFKPPQGSYRLIVMQPDISVGLLTTGGMVEPREDWTKQARDNVAKALAAQQSVKGGSTTVAMTREQIGGDPAMVADLIWLHNAVGQSIIMHKYSPALSLPTKKDKFDWTLGNKAVEYGTATQYDYALFLHAEDSFSSGGRMALQVASYLSCAVGICFVAPGGRQVAFASLVDLKTGQVTWFNMLSSEVGDIRTPDGAEKMVNTLLGNMKASKPTQRS